MSIDDKPPPSNREPLPTFEEEEAEAEHAHEQDAQHGETEGQYYDEEQQYDEHGQPYSEHEGHEQHYDEHGQPYSEHEQYDENGQPYSEEDYAAEGAEDHSGHYSGEAPTQQIDAYPTTPQRFTGPPAPFSRRPLGPPRSQGFTPLEPMHGGPYRVPIPPEPATIPQSFQPLVVPPKPRPFLGSALAIYGVLLWSFVVAGQFATSWITGTPMSNGTAVFVVFAATVAAWVFAIRRARRAAPPPSLAQGVSRGLGTMAVAGLLFILTIIFATIAGQVSSRNHDFAIAFFLVVTAVVATILGPRLTMPVRPERTHGQRFAVVSLWITGAIVTFIAGAELATNG